VDSNVLIYAFTTDARAATAQAVLERGCATGVQGLNEFTNVARRKLRMTWQEVRDALAAIRIVCRPIVPIDIDTHADALRLAERHGFSIFDALMIAAALRAGCDALLSEDLQHGMVIDGRLRVVNPFRDE
jgi:predicted nucleic acid-binding protein